MRVGICGGTFDPVHYGHLILAEQCREQGRLDEVWFVPAARPPHKSNPNLTRFEQRAEMLSLAVAGHPAFRVLDLEKERAGLSYTVDTLVELHRRAPDADLWLLLGSDALADMHTWHEKERVAELAGLLVNPRPGCPVLSVDRLRADLGASAPIRLETIAPLLIDISSHDLRRRAAEGRSLRYFMPRAVECYIQEKRLYRAVAPPA